MVSIPVAKPIRITASLPEGLHATSAKAAEASLASTSRAIRDVLPLRLREHAKSGVELESCANTVRQTDKKGKVNVALG